MIISYLSYNAPYLDLVVPPLIPYSQPSIPSNGLDVLHHLHAEMDKAPGNTLPD